MAEALLSGAAPESLLASQLESFEPLEPAEPGSTIDIGLPVDALINAFIQWRDERCCSSVVLYCPPASSWVTATVASGTQVQTYSREHER